MKNQIVKAEEFGFQEQKSIEIQKGLDVPRAERELLIEEFKTVSVLEITEENQPKFKELRLKLVKNRTQGFVKWHTTGKQVSLRLGQLYDAIKNSEVQINQAMECKLLEAEKHFENLEKERLVKIQNERVALLVDFLPDANERDLSSMDQDVWESFLSTKKEAHLKDVEEKRIAEEKRQQEIQAEKEEQERLRKQNELLLKEKKDEIIKKSNLVEQRRLEAIKFLKTCNFKNAHGGMEAIKYKHFIAADSYCFFSTDVELKMFKDGVISYKEKIVSEDKLKAEQEAREKIQLEEKEKREKLEAELKEKKEAEEKAEQDEKERIQKELNKGDAAKVKDLIKHLEALKNKYTFKSNKNKVMYKNVGGLIDKVTNYINK